MSFTFRVAFFKYQGSVESPVFVSKSRFECLDLLGPAVCFETRFVELISSISGVEPTLRYSQGYRGCRPLIRGTKNYETFLSRYNFSFQQFRS